MKRLAAGSTGLAMALALVACTSPKHDRVIGTAPSNKVWARADGQRMSASPALMRQGQADLTQCRALATVDGKQGQYDLRVLNGCMTSRGYIERDL